TTACLIVIRVPRVPPLGVFRNRATEASLLDIEQPALDECGACPDGASQSQGRKSGRPPSHGAAPWHGQVLGDPFPANDPGRRLPLHLQDSEALLDQPEARLDAQGHGCPLIARIRRSLASAGSVSSRPGRSSPSRASTDSTCPAACFISSE